MQEDWQKTQTGHVAAQLRRYRAERGISAQRLSDRCAELGFPIPRPVLSNLENGRRESVTLAELLVLAAALEIPPVELIIPIGHEKQVEILPDTVVPTWTAARWVRGDREPDWFDRPPLDFSENVAIDLFVTHQSLIDAWRLTAGVTLRISEVQANQALDTAVAAQIAVNKETFRAAADRGEQELMRFRAKMHQRGLIPPPLPAELAHLEKRPERSAPEFED